MVFFSLAAQQGWDEDLSVLLKALLVPSPAGFPGAGSALTMGNDISHRRYWCRKFRRFERLPAEEKTDVPDVPTAQPAQGGSFWSSVSPSEKEKPQGAAAGLHSKEQGRKRKEKTLHSPSVVQGMVRNSELQQLQDTEENLPAMNPAGKTPTWGRAGGHTGVTTRASPLHAAVELEAAEIQPRLGSSSGAQHRASSRLDRARQCRICRWLGSLKTPEGNPKAKPGAASSQK